MQVALEGGELGLSVTSSSSHFSERGSGLAEQVWYA